MSGAGVGLGALLLKGGAKINKTMDSHVTAIANVRAEAIRGAFNLQNMRESRQHEHDVIDRVHGYAADNTEIRHSNGLSYTRRANEAGPGEVVQGVEGGSKGDAEVHPSASRQFVSTGPTKSMEESKREAEMMIGGTRTEKPKSSFGDPQRSSAQFPSMPAEEAPSEALTAAGKPGAGRKPAAPKAAEPVPNEAPAAKKPRAPRTAK